MNLELISLLDWLAIEPPESLLLDWLASEPQESPLLYWLASELQESPLLDWPASEPQESLLYGCFSFLIIVSVWLMWRSEDNLLFKS